MSRTANRLIPPTRDVLLNALDAMPRLREALQAVLGAAGEQTVWLVGGGVRDMLLGRRLVDIDLATSADPARFARMAGQALGSPIEVHRPFGTASVGGPEGHLDFARLRAEHYVRPGALPEPRFNATIEEDLLRRDFSVNALALGLSGPRLNEVVDPARGLGDIATRTLRVLHAGSFRDDATRLWRGARYAARLRLRPEPGTRALIAEGARWLSTISGERLWTEFERTAGERAVSGTLRLLDEWGVLEGSCEGFRVHETPRVVLTRRRGPLDPVLLFAVLLAPLPARESIARRLAVPRPALRALHETVALLAAPDAAPATLESLERASEAAQTAARWLDPPRQRVLQQALRRWGRVRSPLDARELERLGVPRGPALGEWLRRLRSERYLGTLSTVAEARARVRSAGGTVPPPRRTT